MNYRLLSLIAVLLVLIVGSAMTIYSGRPVMQLSDKTEVTVTQDVNTPKEAEPKGAKTEPSSNLYTLAMVSEHGSQSDCWAVVNTDVYDLTTWIDRHPGGPGAILDLCGTDATKKFTRQHGRSRAAQAALALLKIGKLRQS